MLRAGFLLILEVHRVDPEGFGEFQRVWRNSRKEPGRQPRKNNRREEKPAPDVGLIVGQGRESRNLTRKRRKKRSLGRRAGTILVLHRR
jgi:hypothetical protein